jgi:hypothetical protein
MVVCDGQLALIPAGPGRPEAALHVRDPSIAAMLGAVFDNAWHVATPLTAAQKLTLRAEDRGPVVRLGLAAGLADAPGLVAVQKGYFQQALGAASRTGPGSLSLHLRERRCQ